MRIVSFLSRGRRGARPLGGIEATLFHLRRRARDLDRRGRELEGLGLHDLADVGVLHLVALARLGGRVRVHVHGVAGRRAPAAGARGHGTEAGGVGSGLGAQLGEIEVGAGAVAHLHRLPELALGPEAVEDDAVDDDAEDFDDDFDDAADECPVLVIVSVEIWRVLGEERTWRRQTSA
jgi:hypothetical protein